MSRCFSFYPRVRVVSPEFFFTTFPTITLSFIFQILFFFPFSTFMPSRLLVLSASECF